MKVTPYTCMEYQRASRFLLLGSSRIHTGEKFYEYKRCRKAFHSMPHLTPHLIFHIDENYWIYWILEIILSQVTSCWIPQDRYKWAMLSLSIIQGIFVPVIPPWLKEYWIFDLWVWLWDLPELLVNVGTLSPLWVVPFVGRLS